MAEQLVYDFKIIGLNAVNRAFSSTERRMVEHNRRMTREVAAGGGRGGAYRSRPGASVADATRGRGLIAAQMTRDLRRHAMVAERAARADERRRLNAETRIARVRAQGILKAERLGVAAAKREFAARAQARRAFTGSIGKAGIGAVGAVGRMGLGALAMGGGFAAGNALATEVRERAAASKLANQANKPGLKNVLLAESRGVAGFSGEESMGALSEFTAKTGDLNTGRKILGDLGKLALATGTNFEDLGATAGQAFNVIRDQISDPKEQVKELNSLMKVLAAQGEMGAVEIKDLARDFGKLGAATRGFEGGGPALLRTMGAFAQIAVARGGAESSADASTAAARLTNDIVTNRKKFKKLGVGIQSSSDPTKLRDPTQIIADVLDKTGGDVTKTSGLFGAESAKIFKGLAATFSQAEKTKKGSGRQAVLDEVGRFSGANLDERALHNRAASRLADPDVQFKEALKKFNMAVGQELLPVVTKLVGKLTEAMPEISKFAKGLGDLALWLAANPLKGIGLVIAASVAKDVAGAKIGEALSKALASPGGLSVGIVTLGAIATASMTIGQAQIIEDISKKNLAETVEGTNLRAKARAELKANGQLSPETRSQLEDLERKETTKVNLATRQKMPGVLEAVAQDVTGTGPGIRGLQEQIALRESMGSGVIKGRQETQSLLVIDDAARKQAAAAQATKEAADLLKGAAKEISTNAGGPNRGNKPSPVK